jgi:protein-S-isoprenylcysteine O-methyltransferase Ste14
LTNRLSVCLHRCSRFAAHDSRGSPIEPEVAMRRTTAAAGSALFFAVAPTTVGAVIPAVLTGWRTTHPLTRLPVLRIAGSALAAIGLGVLLHAFWRFVVEGSGTPAPVAPTERLVVGGAYRFVRNPMYVAVLATIIGQALLLLRVELVVYAALVWALMATFVRLYEEPVLSATYGEPYDAYRHAVPAWLPRWPASGSRPAI